jgi:TRAP-type mannitol/chloroaromatic compound transport system permease large subunit
MNNYVLVAIPLFILMAQLLDRSKVAGWRCLTPLYVVLGGLKGGLGLAVVVVCTVFAATTGIIGASVVAMGLLATPALAQQRLPERDDQRYHMRLGHPGHPDSTQHHDGHLRRPDRPEGNLGGQSLFAGAIFPGLMLASLYFHLHPRSGATINPKLGPPISARKKPDNGTPPPRSGP